MRSVKLPSGAELNINAAPFIDAKNLYQALLRELKSIQIDSNIQVGNLYKDFFCTGFSSAEIEDCLWKCLERCTYNNGKGNLKIDRDTFEPIEARQDYMNVCMEVAKENVSPFGKALYADYKKFLAMTE